MNEVVDYLCVAEEYCKTLGGLRWASDGEAIEFGDGTTFAFSGEIVSFLEGFASRRPLVDFNHMLHLLYLLRATRVSLGQRGSLQEAFQRGGKVHRNAGAFCAMLCGAVPAATHPPPTLAIWQQVVLRWYRIMEVLAVRGETPTVPPLTPAEFEESVLQAASVYTADDLLHWFKYGNGPVKEVAKTIADEVLVAKPRSLKGVLAELAQRDRLAGAVPFVSQFVSALSLPPRRLAHHELPVGGYSDVTTAGNPEQILPSQFALDDLEFLRRFAERELLYFRREEPHSRTREELVVLLDQGVRTWGIVRLVLLAAVFALGKLADRRRLSFRIASTSGGGILYDPLSLDADTLAAQLEASDLSANPGLALERVLEEPTTATRDVVLLTHPRNLHETDVASAAKRTSELTRLFAVAVTERGDVAFSEVKHGVPLTLSKFHVDLEPSKPPPLPPKKVAGEWSGDVEPIGFPFCFGITVNRDPFHIALDFDGNYLLAASEQGMLHAVRTDGTGFEMLPRGMVNGKVLTVVNRVVGVRVGFVVLGPINRELAAIHYDWGGRRCKAYNLGEGDWVAGGVHYYASLHTLVILELIDGRSLPSALDLDTGAVKRPFPGTAVYRMQTTDPACLTASASVPAENSSPRIRQARAAAQSGELRSPALHVFKTGDTLPLKHPSLEYFPNTGNLRLRAAGGSLVAAFRPHAEGRPLLFERTVVKAWRGGSILAVQHAALRPVSEPARLLVFQLPSDSLSAEPVLLGDYPQPWEFTGFALSGDNRLFARQTGKSEAEVRSVAEPGRVRATVPRGGCHTSAVEVFLGDNWLAITIDRIVHSVRWQQEVLQWRTIKGSRVEHLEGMWPGVKLVEGPGVPMGLNVYDRWRFRRFAANTLLASCDHYGQVTLYDLHGNLVCQMFAFRQQFAAWIPSGIRFGSPALLGGPPTPGAAEAIGHVLATASRHGNEIRMLSQHH